MRYAKQCADDLEEVMEIFEAGGYVVEVNDYTLQVYKDAVKQISCFSEYGVKMMDEKCNLTREDYWMNGESLYATYAYKKRVEDDCY